MGFSSFVQQRLRKGRIALHARDHPVKAALPLPPRHCEAPQATRQSSAAGHWHTAAGMQATALDCRASLAVTG